MIPLIDVHTHLDHPKFKDDLDEVIQRAKKAGLKAIINNGIDPETNRFTLELAKKYDIVKASLGIYPPEVLEAEIKQYGLNTKLKPFDIDEEIEFIKKNKKNIIALGEVGLDYSQETKKQPQKELFQKFIELSEKTKLPLSVHSRKAESEVIEMLESSKAKPVLHCFCGKIKLAKKAADLNYSFSIPCNIVNSQQFQRLVQEVNINQLLTETDAPYLGPIKQERNEPANVIHTIKKIAEIKRFEPEEVANNIFYNYQRLYL